MPSQHTIEMRNLMKEAGFELESPGHPGIFIRSDALKKAETIDLAADPTDLLRELDAYVAKLEASKDVSDNT